MGERKEADRERIARLLAEAYDFERQVIEDNRRIVAEFAEIKADFYKRNLAPRPMDSAIVAIPLVVLAVAILVAVL